MNKLKVMTILGTRPEIIRLSEVIKKLDLYCDHLLIHTGQNYDYELNEIFFKDLGVRKPDIFLNTAGKTSSETIANVIKEADKVFIKNIPDAVLILGDTNSSLSAIPAKRRKIPIFHMEAGNRCFDMRVPEEINRRIVDVISDVNLTYSQIARDYLIKENFPSERIINTGSPMMEVIEKNYKKIKDSEIIRKLNLKKFQYFLISSHREENIDGKNFKKVIDIINVISEKYKIPVIFSTHPRTRDRLKKLKIGINDLVQFHKPFCFTDYINLQINSKCTISDSGTITEESSILNFPALNLRESHERPEGMEEGAVIMTGLEKANVLRCINIIENQKRGKTREIKLVNDYDVSSVSEKIVRIIHSYTDVVKKKVWFE